MLCLNKENIVLSSGSIWCTFYRNESFRKSPIVLFVLLNALSRCSLNVNLTSKTTPRRVWELTWEILLLLKSKGRCITFFYFLLNMISWACLKRCGLKVVFHWKAQSLIFFRSLFNSIADVFVSSTTENREVSSANSLALDHKPSGKSLM